MRRPGRALVLLLSLTLVLSACGKKAPPRWIVKTPPPAPSNVHVHYRPDQIALKWTAPASEPPANDYVVYRASNGGVFKRLMVVGETNYLDQDIVPLASYSYKIAAIFGEKPGDVMEGPPVLTGPVGALASLPVPQGVSVTVGDEGVVLTWEPDTTVSGYNVYSSASPDNFPPAPSNPRVIRDGRFQESLDFEADIEDGFEGEIYYTVRAAMLSTDEGLFVEGQRSPPVSVKPGDFVPSAPTGLDVVPAVGKVVVFWNQNPETWVRGYTVYRAQGETDQMGQMDEFKEIGSSRTLAFPDRNPPKGVLRYRVSAMGPVVSGPVSDAVSVKY